MLTAFPKARVASVKSTADIEHEAEEEALPEVDEEWDPFEEG